jgi:hypothetical protein
VRSLLMSIVLLSCPAAADAQSALPEAEIRAARPGHFTRTPALRSGRCAVQIVEAHPARVHAV